MRDGFRHSPHQGTTSRWSQAYSMLISTRAKSRQLTPSPISSLLKVKISISIVDGKTEVNIAVSFVSADGDNRGEAAIENLNGFHVK